MTKLLSEQVAIMERTIREQNREIECLENVLCKTVKEMNEVKAIRDEQNRKIERLEDVLCMSVKAMNEANERKDELRGLVIEIIDKWCRPISLVGTSAVNLLNKAERILERTRTK